MGRKSKEEKQKMLEIENITQNESLVCNFVIDSMKSKSSNHEYNLKNEIDILINLFYNPVDDLELEARPKTSKFENTNDYSELGGLKPSEKNKQIEFEKTIKKIRLHYLLHNSKYVNAKKQQLTDCQCGSLSDVWTGLIQLAHNNLKDMIEFTKGMPRMNEISETDFAVIFENHNLNYYLVSYNSIILFNISLINFVKKRCLIHWHIPKLKSILYYQIILFLQENMQNFYLVLRLQYP